jgi:pyridoxal phosphate enzyme (YggS family)
MSIDGYFLGFQKRLLEVRDRISEAARKAGRNPADITLLAVSKTQPIENLLAAYQAGLRLFGENRIAEGLIKRPALPEDASLHMIGNIQSNKVPGIPGTFTTVHSVSREKILRALEKYAASSQTPLEILLEVHTSGEEAKSGVESMDELQALGELAMASPHLQLTGLMTMAPWVKDESVLRPCFIQLREWRDQLAQKLGTVLPVLSMGMSNDYEIAIEEGANLVRIGTALFGKRIMQ